MPPRAPQVPEAAAPAAYRSSAGDGWEGGGGDVPVQRRESRAPMPRERRTIAGIDPDRPARPGREL